MIDQEKLNLIEYYKHSPSAFCEDILKIKLLPYQKEILNSLLAKDKDFYYINPYTAHKRWLANFRLELMKLMGMDFTVLSPSGRDDYEKGVLVETLKHKGRND